MIFMKVKTEIIYKYDITKTEKYKDFQHYRQLIPLLFWYFLRDFI